MKDKKEPSYFGEPDESGVARNVVMVVKGKKQKVKAIVYGDTVTGEPGDYAQLDRDLGRRNPNGPQIEKTDDEADQG